MSLGRMGPVKRFGQEVEPCLVINVYENGFALLGEVVFQGVEEFGVGGMELRDYVADSGFYEEEHEAFELVVPLFGGVEVGEGAVAAGELGGGHEGSGEEVSLLDFGDVEEGWERFAVEQYDDIWVGGDEGSRRHVDAVDGGVVFSHAGLEELVAALVVEIVQAVFDGSDDGEAVVAGDFAHWKRGGCRSRGRW